MTRDISLRFRPNQRDSWIIQELLKPQYEESPETIVRFSQVCGQLTDYAFALSTCWVSYTGWSDLALWRRLFSSDRPGRKQSIMKPSELQALERLPNILTVYRAHRKGETDWLSFTLSREKAVMFARQREVRQIARYRLYKRHVLALFTRRGEGEVLVLDPSFAVFEAFEGIDDG